MIASHTRALTQARNNGEPTGQLAARELEIDRLRWALHRAQELDVDVAQTLDLEEELGSSSVEFHVADLLS